MLKKSFILLSFFIISTIYSNSLKGEERDISIGYHVGFPTPFGIFLETKIDYDVLIGVSGIFYPTESKKKDNDGIYGAKFYITKNFFSDDSASFYSQLFIGYIKFGEKYSFFGGGVGAGFRYHYFSNFLYLLLEFSINFGEDINENLFIICPGVLFGLGFNF